MNTYYIVTIFFSIETPLRTTLRNITIISKCNFSNKKVTIRKKTKIKKNIYAKIFIC